MGIRRMDLEDGIRIFADSLHRSRGEAAENYARHQAAELARCGDWEGREVWERVADMIRLREKSRRASA
jgi:hypothetical protein